jgi:hypothetical protein
MSKIGITSGTAIALSVVATVFCYQPSHASDALLAKAQAEFTAKARDAVLQRRAAQAPTGMVLASVPHSEPAQTPSEPVQNHTATSLEPSAPSAPASLETSADRSIPARTATAPVQAVTAPVQPATADVAETPVVVAKLPEVPAPVSSETKADEVQAESKPLPAEAAAEKILAPKQPELPQAPATQVVTPAPKVATPAPQVAMPTTTSAAPASGKIQKTTRESAKPVSAKQMSTMARRYERDFSGQRPPYDMETLRAKAPEIAAAIARYM